MSYQINVPKNEIHLPNICASKEKTTEYGNKASMLQEAVKEARKTFMPDPDESKLSFS